MVKHVQHVGINQGFLSAWGGQKKLLGCGLLGGISAQTETVGGGFPLSQPT